MPSDSLTHGSEATFIPWENYFQDPNPLGTIPRPHCSLSHHTIYASSRATSWIPDATFDYTHDSAASGCCSAAAACHSAAFGCCYNMFLDFSPSFPAAFGCCLAAATRLYLAPRLSFQSILCCTPTNPSTSQHLLAFGQEMLLQRRLRAVFCSPRPQRIFGRLCSSSLTFS